jgi:L-alanine-DL-glutamate epimerase-like enolase superfamily enzyme
MSRKLLVKNETWALKRPFSISRGTKKAADVVVVEIREDNHIGRGESVPYARYGESIDGVIQDIETLRSSIEAGLGRGELQQRLIAGAARNAIDCALWDLEAKMSGVPAWQRAATSEPGPVTTALTVSLAGPKEMAAEAAAYGACDVLKLKLGADQVIESVRAVRLVAPMARLIVDANEAWSLDQLYAWQGELADLNVLLIEQPLPADDDGDLATFDHLVPFCADESCHTADDLALLCERYDYINVKLDKTGGLTEALNLKREAIAHGLGVMVGCMVGTSLAMAPAMLLADGVEIVDLDGPLLLKKDRIPSLAGGTGLLLPAVADLWG